MKRQPIRLVIVVLLVVAVVLVSVRIIRGDPDPPSWATCETEQMHDFPRADVLPLDGVDVELVIDVVAPVAVAHRPGDSSYLLLQRTGEVLRIEDGEVADLALDLSDEVSLEGEQGLFDATFSPDGERVYLHFTDVEGDTTIVEYEVDEDLVVHDASRRVVFELEQPHHWHNGGQLAFGPDGYLYVGLGDGGTDEVAPDPKEHAQNLGTFYGSLLRIDPRPTEAGSPYGIPPDNPFVDVEGARPEIFAYGLRNPWRFDFDAMTGDLWLTDVGHMCWEEINYIPEGDLAGANFGWRTVEAVHEFVGDPPDGVTWPVYVYPLTRAQMTWGQEFPGDDGVCAIIGGAVYHGETLPALDDAFVFSDHCSGHLWAIRMGNDGPEVLELGGVDDQMLAVEAGPDGEMFAFAVSGVYQLVPNGEAQG